MSGKAPDGKYMGSVKVGPKGQIVIPKEVRDMFGIETGDAMLLLADRNRGIALSCMNSEIIDGIINGIIKPDSEAVEDEKNFVRSLAELKENEK